MLNLVSGSGDSITCPVIDYTGDGGENERGETGGSGRATVNLYGSWEDTVPGEGKGHGLNEEGCVKG